MHYTVHILDTYFMKSDSDDFTAFNTVVNALMEMSIQAEDFHTLSQSDIVVNMVQKVNQKSHLPTT